MFWCWFGLKHDWKYEFNLELINNKRECRNCGKLEERCYDMVTGYSYWTTR